ncbi:MAG: hypothetical protein D6718_02550, partial [Acidobacteria bacterium]
WYPASALEAYRCPADRIFAALRARNGLLAPEFAVDAPFVAVGLLARRGRRLPVVWTLRARAPFSDICLGLRNRLGKDGLVVLLSHPGGTPLCVRLAGDVVALDIPTTDEGDLALWRALDALDPGYRERRITDREAIFDEVTLEFAHVPGERHVLRINGHEFGGFQRSDLKFLRLLYLAAARAVDPDIDGGGWLEKHRLQGDEKDHDLEDLRKEFERYHHRDLGDRELKALIKSSPRRDGRIRLAVQPGHIRFDESLARLTFIGERQTRSKKGTRRRTPGAKALAENLERGRQVAKKLLRDARKLGVVPGPIDPQGDRGTSAPGMPE